MHKQDEMPETETQLNEEQEAFLHYLLNDHKTRYQRQKAYMKAYPDSQANSAAANATRLIKNDKIKARIREHFEGLREMGLNDQLLGWITEVVMFDETIFLNADGLVDPELVRKHAPAGYIKGQGSKVKYAIIDGKKEIIEHDYQYKTPPVGILLQIISKIERLYSDAAHVKIGTVYLDSEDRDLV